MSDQSSMTTDTAGITRDGQGTIQEPGSNQNTNQDTAKATDQTSQDQGTKTTDASTKTSDDSGKSLLNQGDGKKSDVTGAPEKYADFTLPEGLKANPEKMASTTALFKELGLPQDGAQKLVDLYVKELTEASEAPVNAWNTMRKEWQTAVTSDPEIGGKLKEVRGTIGKAIDTLGPTLSKDFREAMDLTGAGDHPAFVKAFYKFAQQLTEGRHVNGGGPSPHGQRAPGAQTGTGAAAMYPGLPSSAR